MRIIQTWNGKGWVETNLDTLPLNKTITIRIIEPIIDIDPLILEVIENMKKVYERR